VAPTFRGLRKAVFADFTYHFTTAFDLALGGRYSHTDQSSNVQLACCVLFGPATDFPAIDTSEHSTTWSVAPRFHLSQDSMLYARYSTGYRPGGPNLPTPTLPNPPPLAPDSTRNYELGFKSDLLNHRFSFDIAVFDIDWTDVQILSIVNTPAGPVGINGNSGSARNVGVEWNFSWQPVSGLTLGLLGSYVNAKITEDAPGLGAFNGDKLPYVPDVTATVNATYTWHAFGNFSGFGGGSWSYVGNAYTNFATGAATESHAKLPSYDMLRLHLGLEDGRYNFELYGENVGNSHGITDYQNNGGINQRGLANFLQPRTIGMQLGVKF
jgi:outer membrane receptor protein involved in Fe transport